MDHPDTNSALRNHICPTVIHKTDSWLTFSDVDSVRALGDFLLCKQNVDGVRAFQHRTVRAAEHAVALILKDELHRVLFALRIDYDHTDVSISCT